VGEQKILKINQMIMNAHDTFDKPETLKALALDDLRRSDKGFNATILPKSVNA